MSNATSNTLDKVSGDFESELLAELQNGKETAVSTLESSKKEAKAAVTKILEGSVKQAESLHRQIIGTAELETRNAQLKTLEKAVVEVIDSAVKELQAESGSLYEKALVNLIKEGIDAIGPKAKVSCNLKDRKAVASAISKLGGQSKLVLEEKSLDTIGGVIMTNSDGSVGFDNTFEARLERMRPSLRMEISTILASS